MKHKRKTAILTASLLVFTMQVNAFASVLGELTGGYKVTMNGKTEFHHYSYQTASQKQREYYVEYKPESEVVPVVVNGDSIYGKRTITQAAAYMKKNGMKPMIGINADYFSLQTGVPMGHTIINGEILSSDTTGQNAVGFNQDGTAFISWLEIQSKFIKSDGREMMLDCINKWCQPTISASYLLNDSFAASTKTSGNCKFVIFSKESGNLAIGDSIKLRVDEIFDYDGDILIPEDKFVLVMTNTYGEPSKLQFMSELQVGEVIELKSESVYDKDKWSSVHSAIGSVGGRLIENGKVNSKFEAGTAPRTAVGIKNDGSIVFYVIDGRQPAHSTGVQIKTLAKRMAELGCVEAINLDGGGSTAIAGVFPGSDEMSVLNSPSDGTLRSCANFIFLQDKRPSATLDYNINLNLPENRQYLSGYREKLNPYVTDWLGRAVDSSVLTYSLEQSDGNIISINDDHVVLRGSGAGFLTASAGNSKAHGLYRVYTTPHKITASVNGKTISQLRFIKDADEMVDIDAGAIVYDSVIHSDDSCYVFSCDDEIGYIDDNGVFVPDTKSVKTGSVYIRAGDATVEIPVSIEVESAFADMSFHWAREYANELYHKGIITGELQDEKLVFRPESNITRGEFAVMTVRYMGLDVSKYPEYNFADSHSIPDWQKPYANAAAAEGIISGKKTDDGLIFAGGDSITRAEAMTVLYRTNQGDLSYPKADFKDSNKIPDYAKKPINALVSMGIVGGYEDGTVRPDGNVTRAESVKMIFKCMELFVKTKR